MPQNVNQALSVGMAEGRTDSVTIENLVDVEFQSIFICTAVLTSRMDWRTDWQVDFYMKHIFLDFVRNAKGTTYVKVGIKDLSSGVI